MLIALLVLALCLFMLWNASDARDRAMRALEDDLALPTTPAHDQFDPFTCRIAVETHAAHLIARR